MQKTDEKEIINQEIEKLEMKKARIEKEEEIKNKKAFELSKKLEELKLERDKIHKEITDTKLELNKYCTHEKLRKEENYHEGGYLNKSEHVTTYYCEFCGVEVDKEIQYGSYG